MRSSLCAGFHGSSTGLTCSCAPSSLVCAPADGASRPACPQVQGGQGERCAVHPAPRRRGPGTVSRCGGRGLLLPGGCRGACGVFAGCGGRWGLCGLPREGCIPRLSSLPSCALQMFIDGLPIWGFIGKVEKLGAEGGKGGEEGGEKLSLFTHIHFDVLYNKNRVIQVDISTGRCSPEAGAGAAGPRHASISRREGIAARGCDVTAGAAGLGAARAGARHSSAPPTPPCTQTPARWWTSPARTRRTWSSPTA
jgi:hypothetical protein